MCGCFGSRTFYFLEVKKEMEQEKQEIVAKLYGLRGGLSVLSSIYDEAAVIKENTEAVNKQIEWYENRIRLNNDATDDELEDYKERIWNLESNINSHKRALREASHGAFKILYRLPLAFITAVLLLALLSRYMTDIEIPELVLWCRNIVGKLLPVVYQLQEPIGSILSIVLFVLLLALLIKLVFKGSCDIIKTISELCIISNKEGNLVKLKQNRSICEHHLQQKKAKLEADDRGSIAVLEKQIDEDKQKMVAVMQKYQAAYQATQEQFGSVLDERDWGNVDLIIYNYETGRALDMRDALLQVDNERRNKQLVNAVNEASQAISTTMSRGFGSLETTISMELQSLDHCITRFSRKMSGQLERISDENAAQVALLDKINTSSDKMATDIAALRQIAGQL